MYPAEKLKKGIWLGTTPERFPLADAVNGISFPEGSVHHFLLPAKEWGAAAAEKEAKALAPEAAKALGAWRRAITKSPNAKQITRLQGLARRAEYLWNLVVRRLEISERDISRRIDVWGAGEEWLRCPEVAVQREEVLADLLAVDTPYWRLKMLMDAWCALWFWPVQEAALLDGTASRYQRVPDAPVTVALEGNSSDILLSWEADDLFGGVSESGELTRQAAERHRNAGRRKEAIREVRRSVIALASFDDWLDFAEALLGTHEVPSESLVSAFETLEELTPYEDGLPDLMGMDRAHWLESRFPWASIARDVAEVHGFFHWELEFAQVFSQGGYDIQVGNPPWVRPDWDEALILAELDPWFTLADKPNMDDWRSRKTELLNGDNLDYILGEQASNTGIVSVLSSSAMYSLVAGTRPNLYRGFMCQIWNHTNKPGMAGLIHPDTHFGGTKEGRLREGAYRHLRTHAGFINGKNWAFPHPVGHTTSFGLHIYGTPQDINFRHFSQLYGAETLSESLTHDGSGPLPGIKNNGTWDLRPHSRRLIRVNLDRLIEWRSLSGATSEPVAQTPLLTPVTDAEEAAISALSSNADRLGSRDPKITIGMFENLATKKLGLYRHHTSRPDSLSDVILQGPHLGVSNPFAKQPNVPCNSHLDWSGNNLPTLPVSMVPRVNYIRSCEIDRYRSVQDRWNGRPYTEYFRLAWRAMIPFDTERSLFAALIPPGPAHVHTVQSMALPDNRATAMSAGFWASLPLDYLLRITGRSHLQVAEALKMPAPTTDHPLASPLLLRSLRLNCLTDAYEPLWEELFHPAWRGYEDWGYNNWQCVKPLAANLTPTWQYDTPLRTEHERRAALVELDALVSVWLGITADQLVAIYRSRFPVLADYEADMYFDASGRKIARNHNTYGHGQTKDAYPALLDHLTNPATTPPPEGYTAPFYKADRETEMRASHVQFQARLDAEIAAGRWAPMTPDEDGS